MSDRERYRDWPQTWYEVVDVASGNLLADFKTKEEARAWVQANIPDDPDVVVSRRVADDTQSGSQRPAV